MGISWIEAMTEFEIATRVMLEGTKVTRRGKEARDTKGNGSGSVGQRAYNFAAASRSVHGLFAQEKLPKTASTTSLMPSRARSMPGLGDRYKLLDPKSVFR